MGIGGIDDRHRSRTAQNAAITRRRTGRSAGSRPVRTAIKAMPTHSATTTSVSSVSLPVLSGGSQRSNASKSGQTTHAARINAAEKWRTRPDTRIIVARGPACGLRAIASSSVGASAKAGRSPSRCPDRTRFQLGAVTVYLETRLLPAQALGNHHSQPWLKTYGIGWRSGRRSRVVLSLVQWSRVH